METYRNLSFVKRNRETTNIVFCQSDTAPKTGNWSKCDSSEIDTMNCTQLWTQIGIRYFGYM